MRSDLLRLTRRHFGQLVMGAAASAAVPRLSLAQVPADTPLHGISAFGDLKYPADYPHFDYADLDAPKGGRLTLTVPNWAFNQSPLTFDTLNTFVLQGNAPPRIEGLYESLMTSSLDEPDSLYCALAETLTMSAGGNRFTFALRPQARFSNGDPVRPQDVAFTYRTIKAEGHPSLSYLIAEVEEVTAIDERQVEIRFSGTQTVPMVLAALILPILPESFFEGREFARTGMDEIPGSGAWRVGRYEAGRFIEYERREDYWGAEMPFARGLGHFQTLRVEFFRDRNAELQAFKAGVTTYREEFTTQAWATEYDFPATRDGRVLRREMPQGRRPRFQCWAFNQRRAQFQDVRVRRALNMCFDFEWTNANLMYGLRQHSDSPFENSDFKAEGAPSPEELAVMEPLREALPEEAFGEVWVQPVTDGSGRDRTILRQASELLAQAGWTRGGGGLVNEAGETFRLEYLASDPEQVRVYSRMIETMRLLGIDASIRVVDAAQYQLRQTNYDFDMILAAFSLGNTPTRESLAIFFGSSSADRPGAYNYPGMADEGVDALIRLVDDARSREELVTRMRCLDRVLRARLDWVPNITAGAKFVAHWNMFGYPETEPPYDAPPEALWWFDEDKARAIGRG
ncbi:extracellular solute-binding protein [Aureimonas mangrovi]|uniref:extracellular solute-binding protein n=1 Tax=Aureimonas mangrovi TaxID=2758041 RepID=UPI00163D55FC|nr:extracellular solute-binding protein [Aureimonas mangrovi]